MSIVTKATEYNNAGAMFFKLGDPKRAWSLFKGALEVKLAVERQPCEPLLKELLSENPYVVKAEEIIRATKKNRQLLNQVQDNTSPRSAANTASFSRTSMVRVSNAEQSSLHKQFRHEVGDVFFVPFIFSKPFLLPEEYPRLHSKEARSTSAMVIFNLALVEHIYNRKSTQVVPLYELATSLIVGETVDALGIALINNIGVWCFENFDQDPAERCMDHLSRILRNPTTSGLLNPKDLGCIMQNVVSILVPRLSTSPAA